MSTQVRLVPMCWYGQSVSATSGSRTISRIFCRVNSAAVLLASWLEKKSVKA